MAAVPLLLRGLWWRRTLVLAVLAVAVVTMGVAALGPLYARAADESTLRDTLTQSPVDSAGLHFAAYTSGSSALGLNTAQTARYATLRAYPKAIYGAYSSVFTVADGGVPVRTSQLWRDGICQHIVILSGQCPTRAGQVLAAARTVENPDYRWKIGTRLPLQTGGDFPSDIGFVTIAGTYRPVNTHDPYWFGQIYFGSQVAEGTSSVDVVPALVASRAQFDVMPAEAQVETDVDYRLDPTTVRLRDVDVLHRSVDALIRRHPRGSKVELTTRLPSVLDAAAHEAHLANVGILVTTLQLVLLAWIVLFDVVNSAVAGRGNEIALAKLRGFRPARTIRFGLGEPLALILLAVPLGLLLAWFATTVITHRSLAPDTPITLTWPTFYALGAGFVGAVVAAGLAAWRTLTRPVLAQWRRTSTKQRAGTVAVLVDVVIAAAAVTGVVLLRRSNADDSSTITLVAPGLLVTAVALIGTRLLPLVLRPLLPATRASGALGVFLAARQVVRRPAGLRLVALLAVAVGLAIFAVGAEGSAAQNRTARAEAEIGAARVIAAQYQGEGHDIPAQVSAADPDGRWAMAAATWLPSSGGSVIGTVLAVDHYRLAAVGYPAKGAPANATLASMIGAAPVPELTVTGTALRVRIAATALSGSAQVRFDLRTPGQPNLEALASAHLHVGTADYEASAPCSAGCTLAGLTWARADAYFGNMSGDVRIESISVRTAAGWRPLPVHLTTPDGWRQGAQYGHSRSVVSVVAGGLRCRYSAVNGEYGGIAYAYTPSPLAVVAAPGGLTSKGPYTPPRMGDTIGFSANYAVTRRVDLLPAVLAQGVLIDLTAVRTQIPGFDAEANWQVWLGPHAPADAVARLKRAGLILEDQTTTSSRVELLSRQGPALALYLLLTCAIAGAALAVGATAISISASARRRSFETAALRAAGLARGGLYRAEVLELLLLLGAAVVLGVPTGALAARLTLPVIPQFANATPVALQFRPPVTPVLLAAAGFSALIVLAALIAAGGVMRAARPVRLREAEE